MKDSAAIVTVLVFAVASFAAGFGTAHVSQPVVPQADMDGAWCEATTNGWMAAHVKLYAYFETLEPATFAARFKPLAIDDFAKLLAACVADTEKIRTSISDLAHLVDR
jgi:hypothetical protein